MNKIKLSELLSGTYAEVINSMLPFSKSEGCDEALVRIHIGKFTIEYATWKAIGGFSFDTWDLENLNINGICIRDMIIKEWKVLDEEGKRIRKYHGVLDITLNGNK